MSKKGKIKNGNNKAKHTKLLNQKKNKVRDAKLLNKQRLKAIISKSNLMQQECPCGLAEAYMNCCNIAHKNIKTVKTAEQLMRSRYAAYVLADIDYLMMSHHSSTRPIHEKDGILKWTQAVKWMGLEVLNTTDGLDNDINGTVAFKAFFEEKGRAEVIEEHSRFVKENNHWVYLGEV